MNKLKIFAFILLSMFFLTCEKDDICEPTLRKTPHLVIEFFDRVLINTNKSVVNLKVFDADRQVFMPINPVGTGEAKFVLNANKLFLPLDVQKDVSNYQFIFNADAVAPNTSNTDILTFNYTRDFVFVSRGCGYKAIFNNLLPINLSDGSPADNLWIDNIQMINTNVIEENITHVKIYF